ncbi:PREDICTED: disabled homolog 1-like isoform X4 [Branchiostoma belcheri]|uniref:Disabled homolog 1-like isoform X4 n=1 Tax=Branchiostoma belcheri TaxID=7741 RepID=A0A6P5AGZ6_BRABE|nr:PREDICTED: disabled homolog 1-like isoform X4 [Branchiostoma belcheri]
MTSTVKKGKKEPLTDEEKVKQYEGDGMVFKGKVIGIDDVEAARGDKMCQDSMNKLKLAVKASGAHKQRITISVSLQGLKIIDLASGAINHRHPVHKISFIARDVTDNRAFGWVFSPGEGQHKFFAIKTEKQAEAVVLSIRDLFQTVYNVKKAEMDKKKQAQQDGTTDPTNGESYYQSVQSTKVKSPKKRRKGSPTNESSYDTSTGEPIYQDQLSSNHLNSNTLQLTACLPRVPTNKPVEQDGEAQPAAAEQNAGEAKAGAQVGNLLDLEEELQSLQTGIKDMDKLADLFAAQPNDPFSSPDSTANTPNRQQDLFGSPVAPVNEILTPMGSSSLPGSSATTPGDDFLNSLLQPIKANQPLQPIPVNQSQPVLIPTPVNSQSQSKLQPSPSSQLSSVSLPPPPNSKSQPILQSTPVNQSQTSLHSDTSSQSSGPSFPSLDSGSSKTSPERQIGVIRVLDDPFADSPFQQSPSQSESFSSSSQSQQSNPFSDSPFTVDRKEFVNGVSTTPVVNPFGGGDFSKPTTSFSTGGVITRETKTVFSTPVNKDLVKTDPFGDSFRVTTADSSTLATSAISTSFPESNESRDSERRGNQPPANQAFANPAIQQQIDPFGGSFTAPPAQQPGFSQPPMGFNQPQAGFGQGFGTAPMVTTMQSPPMMAQPGFGSPAGFGASPFNSTTASVGLNTAAIASPPLNTAGQPLVRRPPPEEPKKSDAPDPFADLLDYAADQDKKQMAPPDEGGVEGTSDAFSAYFGSAVGIEADEEAESKPPPSGPPPPLPGADLAGPAPPPRPSANGMAPTPAPRQQNGPASSDPFGFGDSFGAAPPKPTRAAPPTAEADPFGLGSLNPTPAANPAPSNDPFGNEPFAPFDFGGGDSKNTAKAPPKPDPFGLDPFTQQVG